jgi:predicted AAA+ superfamily ATPase
LSRDPSILEARIGNQPGRTWICIDEIQKIPSLLSEVHRLMEKKGYRFALSGSSARKLKRGSADLLAGRAITRHMEGFVFAEIEKQFDLNAVLRWGSLPLLVLRPADAAEILQAYVHTYIREEIKEEGLVRRAEPFLRFLEVAGLVNGQILNRENIARDAKVPRATVDTYFSILEDTLLGHFLPSFRPEAKVRELAHPKFYWFDAGVARGAANLLFDQPPDGWFGWSLETMLFHELRVYNCLRGNNRRLSYYQSGGGSEIDFVVETKKRTANTKASIVCIEVKLSKKWQRPWENPMQSLKETGKLKVEKMFGVYGGRESYYFDGVEVHSVVNFLKMLWAGEVF